MGGGGGGMGWGGGIERQGVGAAGLMAAFDAVRGYHEAQPAEAFNDDPTHKAWLNEVPIPVHMGRMRALTFGVHKWAWAVRCAVGVQCSVNVCGNACILSCIPVFCSAYPLLVFAH
jgi:hypothetical protein